MSYAILIIVFLVCMYFPLCVCLFRCLFSISCVEGIGLCLDFIVWWAVIGACWEPYCPAPCELISQNCTVFTALNEISDDDDDDDEIPDLDAHLKILHQQPHTVGLWNPWPRVWRLVHSRTFTSPTHHYFSTVYRIVTAVSISRRTTNVAVVGACSKAAKTTVGCHVASRDRTDDCNLEHAWHVEHPLITDKRTIPMDW